MRNSDVLPTWGRPMMPVFIRSPWVLALGYASPDMYDQD
jgi:hypothetical protein